jgi:hypothetical protein
MRLGRLSVAVLLTLALSAVAAADYQPTTIQWPGWEVSSSEDLFMGTRHTSYPLMHLFDGRPETAWVPSGKGTSEVYGRQVLITIRPAKPIFVDAVRLMNGYNKSEDLFQKNDRAATVTVIVNGGRAVGYRGVAIPATAFAKTARLKDAMGWHRIALDRRPMSDLTIEVIAVHPGKTHDLCLSEIELWDGDRKIDMALPGVVVYTAGDECGCGTTYALVRRDGTRVATESANLDNGDRMGESAAWSPSHRYVAGIEDAARGYALWVADARAGRLLFRDKLGGTPSGNLAWTGDRMVAVGLGKHGKSELQQLVTLPADPAGAPKTPPTPALRQQ